MTIYLQEAHPTNEWFMNTHSPSMCISQPKTIEERFAAANSFLSDYPSYKKCPFYIDTMKNDVSLAYAGFPERLYIFYQGKIYYQGGLGPFFYNMNEMEKSLIELVNHTTESEL